MKNNSKQIPKTRPPLFSITVNRGWLAIDSSGYVYWYERKPVFNPSSGLWIVGKQGGETEVVIDCPPTSIEEAGASLVRVAKKTRYEVRPVV